MLEGLFSALGGLLPGISAISGLIGIWKALQPPPSPPPLPPAPPTLSWEEAMKRATETLNPIYDEQLQKTLENVDKELIQRGFFGQLPGAVLSGERATDVERAKAAAIAALGGQMQGQSEANVLAQQQLAAQWALNNMQLINQRQQLGTNALMSVPSYLKDIQELFPDWWSKMAGRSVGEKIQNASDNLNMGFTGQEYTPRVSSGLTLPSLEESLRNRFVLGQSWINPY